MPRVSGVYSRPAGIDAVSGAMIESADYNLNVADVETDLNTPRPIVAGGTGATDAAGARANLQAEMANQRITNYDVATFESGTFWSDGAATGVPEPAHSFSGVAILHDSDPNYIKLEAYDLNTGKVYTRTKSAGTWANWINVTDSGAADLNGKVSKAGDTMTGVLVASAGIQSNTMTGTGGSNMILSGSPGLYLRGTSSVNIADDNTATAVNIGSGTATTAINGSGGLNVAAGLGVQGPASLNGTVKIAQATLPTTGALQIGYVAGGGALVTRPSSDTGSYAALFCNVANGFVGSIATTATATTYNTSSDERLKKDLQPFDAGPILDATNVYDFAWVANNERAHGVIAQEAIQIYPEAVTHDDATDLWGVDYSRYVPLLLQEIKSLRARVAALETV